MKKRLTISNVFDSIPPKGVVMLPGKVSSEAIEEARRRNMQRNGEWYNVVLIYGADSSYVLLSRSENWEATPEDVISSQHRFFRNTSWLLA